LILFEAFWVFLFYFAFDMAQIWHSPEKEIVMNIVLNEELLRALAQDDSVTLVKEEYDEEIADLFPDEYCNPMAEFRIP